MDSSRAATAAGALGLVVAGLGVLGPLTAAVGIASPAAGFVAFLLALLASPLALGLGVAGLWNTRTKAAHTGKGRAWLGFAAGLAGVAVISVLVVTRGFNRPASKATATDLIYQVSYHPTDFLAEQTREFSPINDLSSDLEDPPLYPAGETAHADLDWSHDPADAALQETVYPGIKTLHVGVKPDRALELSMQLAEEMGWEIRDVREDDAEFEATATSKVFGFIDDISVRMRPSDKCVIPSHSFCWSTAVDVRSRSRDGESDIGANAVRICSFYERLWVMTGLRPDQSRHRCMKIGRFRASP